MNEMPSRRDFTAGEYADHFGLQVPQREVPANIEAEQALLGAILVNNDSLDAIRVPLEANQVVGEMSQVFIDF